MMYAGCGFRNLQLRNYNVKWGAWFILVTNIAAAVYLSRWHQAGPLDTMDFLSRQIGRSKSTFSHLETQSPVRITRQRKCICPFPHQLPRNAVLQPSPC